MKHKLEIALSCMVPFVMLCIVIAVYNKILGVILPLGGIIAVSIAIVYVSRLPNSKKPTLGSEKQ